MKYTTLAPLPFVGLGLLTIAAGCAVKEEADPVPVPVAIEFPSTPTAVVTQTVRFFLYDGALACNELIDLRKSERPLPKARVEEIRTPCDLQSGTVNFDLERNGAYTLLVAGEVGDRDLLIGCTAQTGFGETEPLPVNLIYASSDFTLKTLEAQTPGSTTKCSKLSDRCSDRCAP